MELWMGPKDSNMTVESELSTILLALNSKTTKLFHWCPYYQTGVVAHTGIAVFLDDHCFTIDYVCTVGTGEVVGQLAGKKSVKSAMEYKQFGEKSKWMKKGDIVQDIDLATTTGRSQGLAVLAALGMKDTMPYHGKDSNCRHHVKQCVRRAAEVSQAMNIPFLIDPIIVIGEIDKFWFGGGEGKIDHAAN